MSSLIRHLRQNAVAYVALFLALGLGTAWALENNSVKSRHIKDGQVKTDDVRDDSLTSTDLADIGQLSATGDQGINDETGGIPSTVALGGNGFFSFVGVCDEDPANTIRASVEARALSSGTVWSADSNGDNGVNGEVDITGPGSAADLIAVGPTTGTHFESGSWSLRGANHLLQGVVAASTDDGTTDCRFGLSIAG